jgi:hypothetical protein
MRLQKDRCLFSRGSELLLLAFPVLLIVAALIEALNGGFWPSSIGAQRWARFLVNVLFLNGLHIVFTFVMIAQLPELQKWSVKKSRFTWPLIAVGLSLIALLVTYAGGYFRVETHHRLLAAQILVFAGMILPAYHNVWQIRGLALTYRQKENYSPTARLKIIQWDKYFYYLLFISYVLLLVSHLGWVLPWESSHGEYFLKLHSEGSLAWLQRSSVVLCTLSSAALIFRACMSKERRKSYLAFYLLRLMLFPLSAYSYVALMGVLASHGLEYILVYRQMVANSSLAQNEKRNVHILSASCAFFVFVTMVPGFFIPARREPALAIVFLSAAGTAINYVHYYLDRLIFMMRDPMTRAHTGPLLMSRKK